MTDYNAETDVPEANRNSQEVERNRQNAYIEELGGWQEQLDMIFQDIDAWRISVKAIKDRFPK
jgi:predicted phage-related endonuclease